MTPKTTSTKLVEDYLSSLGTNIQGATKAKLSDAEAYAACYEWYIDTMKVLPENAAIAARVWVDKYALHNKQGICLEQNPEDMWDRIAKAIADVEFKDGTNKHSHAFWISEFRRLQEGFGFTGQGSVMYSVGNGFTNSSSSNCFLTTSPKDSIEGIFGAAGKMARIFSRRGGVGICLDTLRPRGASVNNAAKTTSGAHSYMDFYSYVTGLIGQCIAGSEMVLTEHGLVPIRSVAPGVMVWTRKGWIENLETKASGIKKVVQVTTKSGYSIKTTLNHIFTTSLKGGLVEQPLSDFMVGDTIVMLPGTPVSKPLISLITKVSYDRGHGADNNGNHLNESVTLPPLLTPDLAYFLGFSYGDGYVAYDKWSEAESLTLACGHKHPYIEDKLCNITSKVFNYTPHISPGSGAVNKVAIHSKLIALFLAQNGLLKQKHDKLQLPEDIKNAGSDVQMAFISGFFDADGYASGKKKGLRLSSVCLSFLQELQALLMFNGIPSKIHSEKRKNGWKTLYTLCIVGAESLSLALSALSESHKVSELNHIGKRDTLLTPYNAAAYNVNYNKWNFVPDNSQKLSFHTFSKLKTLGEISDHPAIEDTITSITPAGEEEVFDLCLASEHLFSASNFLVHNSGRRGALMITMSVSHPDIEAFIQEKSDAKFESFFNELAEVGININDPKKYFHVTSRLKSTTNANVSVVVTRDFLQAVENDTDWELRFDFEDADYESIVRTVRAKDIWDKITYAAWKSAEPGILNMTEIRENSPADAYSDLSDVPGISEEDKHYSFQTNGTNPCVTGDTWVLTSTGPKRVVELLDKPFVAVVNGKEYSSTPFWSTGTKSVFKITTSRGHSVEATTDHKMLVMRGRCETWVPVDQLLPGDQMVLNQHTSNSWNSSKVDPVTGGLFDQGWLVGKVIGNGCYNPEKFRTQVQFWGADAEYMANLTRRIITSSKYAKSVDSPVEFSSEVTHKGKTDYAVKTRILDNICKDLILPESKMPTDAAENHSSSFSRGFIRGLFDADGTVLFNRLKGSSIRLAQTNKEILYVAQRMLLRLGIISTVYENRKCAGESVLPNGRGESKSYPTQAIHELVISRDMIEKYAELIGFYEPSKITKIQKILSSRIRVPYKTSFTTNLVSVTPVGLKEVYDCTVDEVHAFDANGFMAHNCSELPLSFGDTCTLGSFFLPFYIKDGLFDYDLFENNIKLGVRFMDNVKTWDYTNLPLEENEQPSRLGRRIGLGIHGLADCLAMMGFKYDTAEAVNAAEKILEFLKNTAYMASVELGKEKGVFPVFTWEKEKDNAFIKRLAPEVQEAIQKYGRRNISMLTIAPTGSVSILSRNCSSGIEPVFKKSYLRNVKKQGSEDVDTYTIHHQAIEDYPELEHLFVEANDVDPRQRILMQAALQCHIDHAISSTMNLKADTTQEEVGEIYLHAFKAGLKGLTVYRDGCREGILNSIKPKEVPALKERPKTTDIKIHKVKYKTQNYMVLVGLVNGRPIEVFGGLEDGLALPTKYESASLTKKSRGHYSLTVQLSDDPEDVLKVNNIGARFPAEDIMTLTRLVSLSLRNGVSVGAIVDQLQKSAGGMFDAPAIFARVLKNYMIDEDVAQLSTNICPQCGGETEMKREGGCFVETCKTVSCGYVNSKCN